jgi:hypothetical protein
MGALNNNASNPLCLTTAPFTVVALSSRVYPEALTMLVALEPITYICLAVWPLELSFSFSAIIVEIALVEAFLGDLYSFYSAIAFPKPLEAGIMCKKDTFTTTNFSDHLANIDFIFAELD